ncbi:MAG TPA: hypothetical protein PKM43_08210 [Verrucomicrobiota bacterium]|nr:hypothetical protein [Verrucomicrobiota bacterium]HRZ36034.1 hypothetical protein [Candidatus Paceibacterota bacterium]HRZ54763.1 hypothetical protein [Candidatus Paceibacterota bacterium]
MQTGLIICQCAHAGLIAPETLGSLVSSLRAHGTPFDLVPDLCELAARHDPRLEALARAPRPTVLACHERAVRSLFHMAAAPLDPAGTLLLDVRTGSADEALARLGIPRAAPGSLAEAAPAGVAEAGWIPWFPVIDGERCTNCQQCLGFCLFGVYDLSPEGRVRVANPQACKTNCPACARICPEVAIIFPKYQESPINGGPCLDEAKEKARIKADLEAVLGSEVYAKLAARRAKVEQKRLLRQNVELAGAERQRHQAADPAKGLRSQEQPACDQGRAGVTS